MILKKPYAFLIKHFRLFHLIITTFLGIVVYNTNKLLKFLNLCINESTYKSNALEYVNYNIFWDILIAIVLMYIIRLLLKYKDKPRSIYLFGIIYYLIATIVIFLTFNYLNEIITGNIDNQIIRLYRDATLIILSLQYIFVIVFFIRGLGFDIKKFNFRKDFAELEISEEDAEEIEVDIFKNKNNVIQSLRKQRREFGYYLKEFKGIYITILLILIVIIFRKGYIIYNNKYKIYSELDIVGTNNLLGVNESYYKKINNKEYIIIKVSLKTNKTSNILNTGVVSLVNDDKIYYPNKNICSQFGYYGVCYKKQYLTDKFEQYILTYEAEIDTLDDLYLNYSESYDIKYKIKLNPKEE